MERLASYAETKFHDVLLSFAVARLFPEVKSNSLEPGWVPTKMGGAGAPDDLEEGHLTQTWLAVSDEATAKVSGAYWHHRKPRKPAADAVDTAFQDRLIARLAELTGVKLS